MPYIDSSGVQVPVGTDSFNPTAQFKTWQDKNATYNNRVVVNLDSDRLALAAPVLRDGLECYVTGTDTTWLREGSIWRVTLEDTDWITATLHAPWVLNTTAPAYRRLNGVVYFRGRASAPSTGSSAFTVPAGFRPAETRVQVLDANGSYVRSSVANTGGVGPVASGTFTALSFDGIAPYPAAG